MVMTLQSLHYYSTANVSKSFSVTRLNFGQGVGKGATYRQSALIPTGGAQYATLSKGNWKVPPRIDAHIERLLKGGYHYINIT